MNFNVEGIITKPTALCKKTYHKGINISTNGKDGKNLKMTRFSNKSSY